MQSTSDRSFEQEIWEDKITPVLKPVYNFSINFIKGLLPASYGTFATPFRIPTFMRRADSNGLPFHRIKSQEKLEQSHGASGVIGHSAGLVTGGVAGVVGLSYVTSYCISQATNGNYIPACTALGLLALTNTASGVFESNRANRGN
jgi:hypothetical protein